MFRLLKFAAVLALVCINTTFASPAVAATKEVSCDADGDRIWVVVYYGQGSVNWFIDKNVFTLEDSSGDNSNVNIRVRGKNDFLYFTWNSPDNLSGGNTYTKQIDVQARLSNDPADKTIFIPAQTGFDPQCTATVVFDG